MKDTAIPTPGETTAVTDDSHYRKLEAMYHDAPCNADSETTLDVSEGRAEVQVPVERSQFHPAGAVHGSVYFKAMDDAAFFAANSLVEDVFVLTANFTVYFTRPVSSGVLRAVGDVTDAMGSGHLARAVVYDADDRPVARGSGTFVRSDIDLTPELGYR